MPRRENEKRNSTIMFRQLDFRSFFNFLGRNKLYTAINIFGLSLSLMFVILIADYTVRQLTVDSFHSKASPAPISCKSIFWTAIPRSKPPAPYRSKITIP